MGLKARMEQNFNLYCLFGLTQNDLNWTKENQIISFETLNGFGDYACIITDTQKFIDRVGEKLNMKGFDIWECRGVKYFRETHMGEVTPLMKRRN